MKMELSKSFVYGTVARWLGDEGSETATHSWSAFVRSADDSDLSVYVRKVDFHLHPSFPEPVRSVSSPPYEIEESGWGEFEIIIRVYFHDASLKPVEFFHMLKLFEVDDAGLQLIQPAPVVREVFDQFVFTKPSPAFAQLLSSASVSASPGDRLLAARFVAEEDAHLAQMAQASSGITGQIEAVHDAYMEYDQEIRRLKALLAQHAKSEARESELAKYRVAAQAAAPSSFAQVGGELGEGVGEGSTASSSSTTTST